MKIKKNAIIIGLAVLMAAAVVYILIRMITVDRSCLDQPADKIGNGNINALLSSPEDWQQITTDKFITESDMSMLDGSASAIPITAEIARQFLGAEDQNIQQYFLYSTAQYAYENLIDSVKQCTDFGNEKLPVSLVFAEYPSEEDIAYAKQQGVELDIQPVAMDALVFITHKDNPVDSLTTLQIRDIYSGKLTNWKEVGGNNEKITAYQRSKDSPIQTAMEELAMQGSDMANVPVTLITEGRGQLTEEVAEYRSQPGSIGYTYGFYMNNLYKSDDIKIVSVDGVPPNNDNIISGNYPFAVSYYAAIRSDEPEDSVARRLRDYMLSDEGQRIVEQAGFCPIKR